jgi:hypothetical protein
MKRVALVFLFFCNILIAQSSGSLAEEFSKLNDYLKNRESSPEEKKKVLETNVMNSVKITLSHKFSNPKKEFKDLKFQDIQTERPEGTNNLYVKYKNFYISYSFVVDPEKYLASPIEETVLEKPAGADIKTGHTDEKVLPAK